jgi:hypothetical protein
VWVAGVHGSQVGRPQRAPPCCSTHCASSRADRPRTGTRRSSWRRRSRRRTICRSATSCCCRRSWRFRRPRAAPTRRAPPRSRCPCPQRGASTPTAISVHARSCRVGAPLRVRGFGQLCEREEAELARLGLARAGLARDEDRLRPGLRRRVHQPLVRDVGDACHMGRGVHPLLAQRGDGFGRAAANLLVRVDRDDDGADGGVDLVLRVPFAQALEHRRVAHVLHRHQVV